MNSDPEGTYRHALRLGDVRVDGGEEERPRDDGEHDREADGEDGERSDLIGRDREQVAEQDARDGARVLGCERREQHAETGGERRGSVPVETSRFDTRLPSAPIARPPLTQKIASPSVTGMPTSTAKRRAGEADVREGVRGERVAPDHDEVADQPGGDRRRGCRR